MVDVHQNLNHLRDLTTSLSGMVCHPWPNLPTKFEVYISTYYEDMKGDAKYRSGVVWGS